MKTPTRTDRFVVAAPPEDRVGLTAWSKPAYREKMTGMLDMWGC